MTGFLRSVRKHMMRAFALACRALAAPLPGVDHIVALTTMASLQRKERQPASGCIDCDLLVLGCDAGRPHWIHTIAVTGPGKGRRHGDRLAGV